MLKETDLHEVCPERKIETGRGHDDDQNRRVHDVVDFVEYVSYCHYNTLSFGLWQLDEPADRFRAGCIF